MIGQGEDGPYVAAWRRQRVRERLGWIVPLGGAALLIIAIQISISLTHSAKWLNPVGIIWFIASVVVSMHWCAFDCPRCGNAFYYRPFRRNGFARRCMNCGLPKWAPGPNDEPAREE
jgi:predicted RNA-binding Zn-ribbon protein involved in translation (DUF1610 family)